MMKFGGFVAPDGEFADQVTLMKRVGFECAYTVDSPLDFNRS